MLAVSLHLVWILEPFAAPWSVAWSLLIGVMGIVALRTVARRTHADERVVRGAAAA